MSEQKPWFDAIANDDLPWLRRLMQAYRSTDPSQNAAPSLALVIAIQLDKGDSVAQLCTDPHLDLQTLQGNGYTRLQNAIVDRRFSAALALARADTPVALKDGKQRNLPLFLVLNSPAAQLQAMGPLMEHFLEQRISLDVPDEAGLTARSAIQQVLDDPNLATAHNAMRAILAFEQALALEARTRPCPVSPATRRSL